MTDEFLSTYLLVSPAKGASRRGLTQELTSIYGVDHPVVLEIGTDTGKINLDGDVQFLQD